MFGSGRTRDRPPESAGRLFERGRPRLEICQSEVLCFRQKGTVLCRTTGPNRFDLGDVPLLSPNLFSKCPCLETPARMIFVDGAKEVRQHIANRLRYEFLALSVKKQPPANDLVLALEAEEQRMPNRSNQRIASSAWWRLTHIRSDPCKPTQQID